MTDVSQEILDSLYAKKYKRVYRSHRADAFWPATLLKSTGVFL